MHPWEEIYLRDKFKINTKKPSVLVEKNKACFKPGSMILDAGCGNGRNSLYLTSLGCFVDAVDVADLNWINSLPKKIKEKINFIKGDILTKELKESFYDAVIAMRLIQYLDSNELGLFLKNVSKAIKGDGIFLLSYTRSGGVHNIEEVCVPKFEHKLDKVVTLLKKEFKTVDVNMGEIVSTHVGYSEPVESYDIFCLK